jgi:hypothetical protein
MANQTSTIVRKQSTRHFIRRLMDADFFEDVRLLIGSVSRGVAATLLVWQTDVRTTDYETR